jgi:hypothetical protein
MTVDSALGVSIQSHHAGDFAGEQNSLHALVVKRESSEKGFPYLLGHSCWADPWVSKTFTVSVSGAQRSCARQGRKERVDQGLIITSKDANPCVVHNFAGGAKLPSQFLHM